MEKSKIWSKIRSISKSGKKLLMRFWDVQKGQVSVNDTDVRQIPTRQLLLQDHIKVWVWGKFRGREFHGAARQWKIHMRSRCVRENS